MNLSDIQKDAAKKFLDKDRQTGGPFLVSVLAEEAGELARAVRRNDAPNVAEEAGDVVWMALCIANLHGVDIQEQILKKYVRRDPDAISSKWQDVPWKKT